MRKGGGGEGGGSMGRDCGGCWLQRMVRRCGSQFYNSFVVYDNPTISSKPSTVNEAGLRRAASAPYYIAAEASARREKR